MKQRILEKTCVLRAQLHAVPELSGRERGTKECLLQFLRENTSLWLDDRGAWLCAVHGEPGANETVALRADMDALPVSGGASHLCGHDGHSAALAGLGLWLEGRRLGRNVALMFQHAEETGEGGKVCAAALEEYAVSRVYAWHNIPGQPEGTVLLRRGVFACASRGMTVSFTGSPAHAAYPEEGRNPGFAAARLVAALPELSRSGDYGGLTMATLVGAEIGARAFGTAAGRAEVLLTLRAWREEDMALLLERIEALATKEAKRDGIAVSFGFQDVFPATLNDEEAQNRLEAACRLAGLSCTEALEPFRWSEDFGWYGHHAQAAMAGLGAGETTPGLHTSEYQFNDRILPVALALLSSLAENG